MVAKAVLFLLATLAGVTYGLPCPNASAEYTACVNTTCGQSAADPGCVKGCASRASEHCKANSTCTWNEGTWECNTKQICTHCRDCVTEESCKQAPSCDWVSLKCVDAMYQQRCGMTSVLRASSVLCAKTTGCSWYGGSCKKDSCTAQSSQGGCSKQAGCVWSNQRCQTSSAVHVSPCHSSIDSAQCKTRKDCAWLESSKTCEPLPCSSLSSEGPCAAQGGCLWKGSHCVSEAAGCGGTSQHACEAEQGCTWDAHSSSCSASTSTVSCSSLPQASCGHTAGCSWDGHACSGTPSGPTPPHGGPATPPPHGGTPPTTPAPHGGTPPTPPTTPAPHGGTPPAPPTTPAPHGGTPPAPPTTPAPHGGTPPTSPTTPAPHGGTPPTPPTTPAPPPTPPSCASHTDSSACGGQSGCTWNGHACEDCSSLTVQTTCDAATGCKWDGHACAAHGHTLAVLSSDPHGGGGHGGGGHVDCTKFTTQAECAAPCEWDNSKKSCKADSCVAVTLKQGCETFPECAWDGFQCTVDCSRLLTELACMSLSGCVWDLRRCVIGSPFVDYRQSPEYLATPMGGYEKAPFYESTPVFKESPLYKMSAADGFENNWDYDSTSNLQKFIIVFGVLVLLVGVVISIGCHLSRERDTAKSHVDVLQELDMNEMRPVNTMHH